MNIGDKVKVSIQNPEEYTRDAFRALSGARGKIKKIKSKIGDIENILVVFDAPVVPWHSAMLECSSFWFEEKDLISI